jgi:hypothetical protein
MRNVLAFVLVGVVVIAVAGCGGGGGSGSGDSGSTGGSKADAPASPTASPSTSPPHAAKSGSTGAGTMGGAGAGAGGGAAKADAAATTRQVLGLPAGWEIAPRADYTARQAAGQVTVTARGENPTGGYEVKLFESPLRIWPPQWILARKKPDGPATQAITSFETSASFKSDRKVASVVVNDASGRRMVNVAQAQN